MRSLWFLGTAAWTDSLMPLIGVLAPLVGVPLTLIALYLRSLRDQQAAWQADQVRRIGAIESSTREFRTALREFERDYTTKEEWLRECMQARRTLSRLVRITARLEARSASAARADGDRSKRGRTRPLEGHNDG